MCVTWLEDPDNGHAHIVMPKYLLQYRSDGYSNVARRSRISSLNKIWYINIANMFLHQDPWILKGEIREMFPLSQS